MPFFQLNSSCTLSCSFRLNFARSLLILCLVRSVSNSEARSLASASPSSFIFTEGDLINKPIFVTADNRLKYRAICCSINRSVLDNISGWCHLLNLIFEKSHQSRLPYQFPPLSSTRLGDNSLLSEKRWLFFVFSKEPIQSPLGQLGIVRQNFYLRPFLERSHPLQNGKPVLIHFLLILSQTEFFGRLHCVCLCLVQIFLPSTFFHYLETRKLGIKVGIKSRYFVLNFEAAHRKNIFEVQIYFITDFKTECS